MEDPWTIYDLYGIPEITLNQNIDVSNTSLVPKKQVKGRKSRITQNETKKDAVIPGIPAEIGKYLRFKEELVTRHSYEKTDFFTDLNNLCTIPKMTNNVDCSEEQYDVDITTVDENEESPLSVMKGKGRRRPKANGTGLNLIMNKNKMSTTGAIKRQLNRKESPPTKKSKKNSKSRKLKPQLVEEDETSGDLVIVDEATTPLKMKLTPNKGQANVNVSTPANKKRKKRDSASSDEERWLTAIESGKLEDVDDELKKIKPKDPALMTARQRAMYDRGADGSPAASAPTLMSLPTGYKEKVMTAEAIQKAALKSQKRKQLADEKREKDKKKTMERLLKKQDSKAAKAAAKTKAPKTNMPVILYKQNLNTTMMCFPSGFDYPLSPAIADEPPRPKYCSMGCGNLKRYTCSKTGIPLCSIDCYKRNISDRII